VDIDLQHRNNTILNIISVYIKQRFCRYEISTTIHSLTSVYIKVALSVNCNDRRLRQTKAHIFIAMSTTTDESLSGEDGQSQEQNMEELQMMEVDEAVGEEVSGHAPDMSETETRDEDDQVFQDVVMEDQHEHGVAEAEGNFAEEQAPETEYLEEAQFLEDQVVLIEGEEPASETEYIVTEDAIVIGGEEDIVLGVEGDGEIATTYEEAEGDYSDNNTYAPEAFIEEDDESRAMNVVDSGEVIEADTEVVETVIDSSVVDEDKENGESLLPEYPDEAEIEPVLEITRRRLSHEGNCYW